MYSIIHCPPWTQTLFRLLAMIGVPQVRVLGPVSLTQAQTCTPTNTQAAGKNPWWKKKWESVWSSEPSKWKPCSPPTNGCVCMWIGKGGCDWGTHQQSPPSLVTIHPGGLLTLCITQQRDTVSLRSSDLKPASAEEPAATVLEKLSSIPSRLQQSTMAGSAVLHLGFLLTLAGILLLACSSAQRVRGKFSTTVPHTRNLMPCSTGALVFIFCDAPVCVWECHAFLSSSCIFRLLMWC